MNSGIYIILNTVNDKIYVGSSIDTDLRWLQHEYKLNKETHDNRYLQFAWNKYGADTFLFIVVEEISDPKMLIEIEQIWIDRTECYNSKIGYNLALTAGSQLEMKRTEKQRRQQSERMKGHIHSPETREKLRISNIGQTRSENFRLRMSHVMKGKQNCLGNKHTDETKNKISKKLKGITHSLERRKKQAQAQRGIKRPFFRKPDKWPHENGNKCKCEHCREKIKIYMKNYRKTYKRKKR